MGETVGQATQQCQQLNPSSGELEKVGPGAAGRLEYQDDLFLHGDVTELERGLPTFWLGRQRAPPHVR